jgi:hypothetical protein
MPSPRGCGLCSWLEVRSHHVAEQGTETRQRLWGEARPWTEQAKAKVDDELRSDHRDFEAGRRWSRDYVAEERRPTGPQAAGMGLP